MGAADRRNSTGSSLCNEVEYNEVENRTTSTVQLEMEEKRSQCDSEKRVRGWSTEPITSPLLSLPQLRRRWTVHLVVIDGPLDD